MFTCISAGAPPPKAEAKAAAPIPAVQSKKAAPPPRVAAPPPASPPPETAAGKPSGGRTSPGPPPGKPAGSPVRARPPGTAAGDFRFCCDARRLLEKRIFPRYIVLVPTLFEAFRGD